MMQAGPASYVDELGTLSISLKQMVALILNPQPCRQEEAVAPSPGLTPGPGLAACWAEFSACRPPWDALFISFPPSKFFVCTVGAFCASFFFFFAWSYWQS